jgi:hypothetical protein
VGHVGTAAGEVGGPGSRRTEGGSSQLGLTGTWVPGRANGTLLSSGPSVLVCPFGGHSTVSASCPDWMSLRPLISALKMEAPSPPKRW